MVYEHDFLMKQQFLLHLPHFQRINNRELSGSVFVAAFWHRLRLPLEIDGRQVSVVQ